MRRFPRFLGPVLACVLAVHCGDGEDLGAPNLSDVATVRLEPSSRRIGVGTRAQFLARAFDADGEELPASSITFRWSVDRTDVADVDPEGVVLGKAAGRATVRVEALAAGQDEPAVGTGAVEVLALARVGIEPSSALIRVGETAEFRARAWFADGSEAEGVVVTWRTANSLVAVVTVVDTNPTTVRGVERGLTELQAAVGPEASPVVGVATIEVGAAVGSEARGLVVNAVTGVGVAGAIVEAATGQTATDGRGAFSVPVGPTDTTISLRVHASGYETVTVRRNFVPGDAALGSIPLVPAGAAPGGISGVVKHARTAQGLGGVLVSLARGIDDALRRDPTLPTRTTDASGAYAFTDLAPGTYTIIAEATGYESNGTTGIVVGNGATVSNQDVVLSPLGSRDIRIVLTWGEQPGDLDAHLTGPGFHVFFADRGSFEAPPFVGLDVDDRDGRGPETITITQLNGTYRFSVHDFTNRGTTGSTQLAQSGAEVNVYTTRGLLLRFRVPDAPGNLWTVFTVSGSIGAPTVSAVGTMSDVADPGAVPGPGRPEMSLGKSPLRK